MRFKHVLTYALALAAGGAGAAPFRDHRRADGVASGALSNFLIDAQSTQTLAGPVSARNTSGNVNLDFAGAASSLANSGSLITATATGNLVPAAGAPVVALTLIGAAGGDEGIGVLALQAATRTVTAANAGGSVTTSLAGTLAGRPDLSGNGIAATATANQDTPTAQVSGVIPIPPYRSTRQGTQAVAYDKVTGAATLAATGSTAIGNGQVTVDAGPKASVSNAVITFADTANAGTIGLTATIDGNAIAAAGTGNLALGNDFVAQSGGGPAYAGSVSLSNLQAYSTTSPGTGPAASVANAAISGSIAKAAAAFTGTLILSGNAIGAAATGNAAYAPVPGGVAAPGNAIVFAGGIGVTGSGSGNANSFDGAATTTTVTADADLSILDAQTADGAAITASVTGAAITGSAANLSKGDAGGAIRVDGNAITAAAAGNAAVGVIAASGPAIDATAAAAGYQAATGTPIAATVSGGSRIAALGATAGAPVDATVEASGNIIGAAATGNLLGDPAQGGTPPRDVTIMLDAADLSAPRAPSGSVSLTIGSGQSPYDLTVGGGVTLTSVQQLFSSTVSAALDAHPLVEATNARPASGTKVLADANGLAAAATGSALYASVSLAAGSGTVQAALGSSQLDEASRITAVSATPEVLAQTGNLGPGSSAEASNNSLSVQATADTAQSLLTVAIGSLSASIGAAGTAAVTRYGNGDYAAGTTGGLTLLSDQHNAGAVSATATRATAEAEAGTVSGSAVTVDGNSLTTAATGNTALSSVALSGGAGTLEASLANAQSNEGAGMATATATGAALRLIGSAASAGAALDMVGNTLTAAALGNAAQNQLGASFASLTVDGVTAPAWTSDTVGTANGASAASAVSAGLVLLSDQRDTGLVKSTLTGTLGVTAGGVDAATARLEGNGAAASAIADSALNTLTLAAASLATGSGAADRIAALSSTQRVVETGSATAAGATLGASVTLSTGALATATLTAEGNTLAALAAGNVAVNALAATGTRYSAGAPPAGGAGTLGNDPTALARSYVQSEFALQSVQSDATGPGKRLTYSASVKGGNAIVATIGGTIAGSTVSLDDNVTRGAATANQASNLLSLGTVQSPFGDLSTSAGLQNVQISGAWATAAVGTAANDAKAGITVSGSGHKVSDSTLSASGNVFAAEAFGNTAVNGLSLDAAALASGAGRAIAIPPGGYVSVPDALDTHGGVSPSSYTVGADYGLGNNQIAGGAVTAQTDAAITVTVPSAIDGGSVTLSGNTLSAVAELDNARNGIAIAAGTGSGIDAALGSVQSASNVATASVGTAGGAGFILLRAGGALGGASGLPVTVSGNAIAALAANNDAASALTITAAGDLTGGAAGNAQQASLVHATSPSPAGPALASADVAVLSAQYSFATGPARATVTLGDVGVDAGALGGSGGAGISVAVSDNTITATADANVAVTSLALDAADLGASGSLLSFQSAAGGAVATIGANGTATTLGVLTGGPIAAAAIEVSGNSLVATANGNSAVSTLTAIASAAYIVPAAAAGASATATTDSARANYSALNGQFNIRPVNASALNYKIGVNPTSTAHAVIGGRVTVAGNRVAARAAGNAAATTIALAALPGGAPSAALNSVQDNAGGVSATVRDVAIGIGAGTGSSGSFAVSGNTISATAVGNAASDAIVAAPR